MHGHSFQEVVPLRAENVLGPEKSKISMRWNSLIRSALMKPDTNKHETTTTSDEYSRFRCIISKQMVGILISVWVRAGLRPYVRSPSVSCVGCGIMGCLGNKVRNYLSEIIKSMWDKRVTLTVCMRLQGSVSVRFRLHETSFCFVCSHLASGGREGDQKCRNSNVEEIFSRTIFPRGNSLDLPTNILHHEYVIISL